MKKIFIASLLVAASVISTSASAAILELNGNIANGMLANGNHKPVFTGLSSLTGDYTINSLSYSFTFTDDGTDTWSSSPTTQKTTIGKYQDHPWTDWKYREVDVVNTTVRTSQQESAALWFGDLLLGTDSTKLTTSQKVTDAYSYLHYDGKECEKVGRKEKCTYYKSAVNNTDMLVSKDYTGSFTIAGVTSNQSIIQHLLDNNGLNFKLKIGGDLLLTGSQVMLDYTKVELPAEVPEPSSILLAGAGLAAIGFARRRRGAAKA